MSEEQSGEWFFVQTLSGHEMKAKDSIARRRETEGVTDRIFDAIVPVEKVTEVKQGTKRTTTRKFFPGYILLIANLYDENRQIDERVWRFVKETPGVTGFIGEKPKPLSEKEILDLKDMMREDMAADRPKVDFAEGEMVKIKDGPFENFEGKVESTDPDHGKLHLSVSIFGRSTPVEVGYWQVERE